MTRLLASLMLSASLVSSVALADDSRASDQATDLDSKSKSKKNARSSSVVREVTRGFYLKTGVGSLAFVGGSPLSPGTALSLTFGQDFIDKEKTSAAWEVFLHQSLNNGRDFSVQNSVQGDIHTFSVGAAGEYSAYVGRRLGIGGRVGGGLTLVPLLMNEDTYAREVVGQTWGERAAIHDAPTGMVFFGPTAEYYTKLSHFSIGLDVSLAIYFGLDFGIDTQGYVKYTF